MMNGDQPECVIWSGGLNRVPSRYAVLDAPVLEVVNGLLLTRHGVYWVHTRGMFIHMIDVAPYMRLQRCTPSQLVLYI